MDSYKLSVLPPDFVLEDPEQKFNQAADFTFGQEGGAMIDKGRPTNYGIRQDILDHFNQQNNLPLKSVNDLTPDEARFIAKKAYFDTPGFDKLPADTASVLFDYGFNSGPKTAVKALQSTVGTTPDGIMGPKTLKATDDFIRQNGEKALLQKIIYQRQKNYERLLKDPSNKQWRNGWMNRIKNIKSKFGLALDSITGVGTADAAELPPGTYFDELPQEFQLEKAPGSSPSPAQAGVATPSAPGLPDLKNILSVPPLPEGVALPEGFQLEDQLKQGKAPSLLDKVQAVFSKPPEQRQAEAANIYAISKTTGLDPLFVEKNYDKIKRDPSVTGIKPTQMTNEEFMGMLTLPAVGAGVLAVGPIATAAGIAGFTLLDHVIDLKKFVPENASDEVKTAVDLADFIGKGLIAHGISKASPKFIEAFTKSKLEQYKLPEKVSLSGEQVRDIYQTGKLTTPEQVQLYSALDLTRDQLKQAISKGVDINVPAEKIVTLTDKPWWSKVKGMFGISSEPATSSSLAGKPTQALPGLPDYSKDLPKDNIVRDASGQPISVNMPEKPPMIKEAEKHGTVIGLDAGTKLPIIDTTKPAVTPTETAGTAAPVPATAPVAKPATPLSNDQIKAVIEKAGGKFKAVTTQENSVYDNEPTIYFDDANGSTKTIRPSQLTVENVQKKMRGEKITTEVPNGQNVIGGRGEVSSPGSEVIPQGGQGSGGPGGVNRPEEVGKGQVSEVGGGGKAPALETSGSPAPRVNDVGEVISGKKEEVSISKGSEITKGAEGQGPVEAVGTSEGGANVETSNSKDIKVKKVLNKIAQNNFGKDFSALSDAEKRKIYLGSVKTPKEIADNEDLAVRIPEDEALKISIKHGIIDDMQRAPNLLQPGSGFVSDGKYAIIDKPIAEALKRTFWEKENEREARKLVKDKGFSLADAQKIVKKYFAEKFQGYQLPDVMKALKDQGMDKANLPLSFVGISKSQTGNKSLTMYFTDGKEEYALDGGYVKLLKDALPGAKMYGTGDNKKGVFFKLGDKVHGVVLPVLTNNRTFAPSQKLAVKSAVNAGGSDTGKRKFPQRSKEAIDKSKSKGNVVEEYIKPRLEGKVSGDLLLKPEEDHLVEELNKGQVTIKGDTLEYTKPAATPQEFLDRIDQLNKFAQMQAILRRGMKSRNAAGMFSHGPRLPKEGIVKIEEGTFLTPSGYVSTLAHELGHAIEYHVVGKTNNAQLKLFGDKIDQETRQKLYKELMAVTEDVSPGGIKSKPEYYLKPAELIARFFEKMIASPGDLEEMAPTAVKLIHEQAVRFPIIEEFLEAARSGIDKGAPKFVLLRDLKQTYQKFLGKRVGDIAYGEEMAYRAMKERSKIVLEKFIEDKFKGIKDAPENLFRAAEAIKVSRGGVPEFGTRVYELAHSPEEAKNLERMGWENTGRVSYENSVAYPLYAKYRYTPEQAKVLFDGLSPEGKKLILDFTAERQEAKDYFNREMIAQTNKVQNTIEGWVHHYFEEEGGGIKPGSTMVQGGKRFKSRMAGTRKHRAGVAGYVEDFKKAMTKALVDLEGERVYNDFITRQFARVTKPLPEGQKPDPGWVEVVGTIKGGVGMAGEKTMKILDAGTGKMMKPKYSRYQMPAPIYERYKLWKGLAEEASTAVKIVNDINRYWRINILAYPGTASTNFISGGIQYSAKILTDFYREVLTGNASMPQTRRNIGAMFKVLMPKGWAEAPDWVYGADLSNFYGQFMKQKSIGGQAVDHYANAALKLFSTYERYWKKVILTAENVQDLNRLMHMTPEGLKLPTKEEREMIAAMNSEVDLYAYDYDNVPLWLEQHQKSVLGQAIKPFAKWPYKYMKQVSDMIGSAFDQSQPWQDRVAKILALSTMVATYAAYSNSRKKEQRTPMADPNLSGVPARLQTRGRLFITTDDQGREMFMRTSKYPFVGLTEAGMQMVNGNFEGGKDAVSDMLGSLGPVGTMGLLGFGYVSKYQQYTPVPALLGQSIASFMPLSRMLTDVSRMLDPYQRKQETFGQAFTSMIPTTDADLQEKLHGKVRTERVPIEGNIARDENTAGNRGTKDVVLENYWQDILLGMLSGVYRSRIDPDVVQAYIIRAEKNAQKREEKKTTPAK